MNNPITSCEWCKHGFSVDIVRGANVRCTIHKETKKAQDKCNQFERIKMSDCYPIKVKGWMYHTKKRT